MNASKEKFTGDDLPELFDGARKVTVAKGKKVLEFAPAKDDPAEIAKVALGPSGNLRAPSIRAGKTWFVGFHEEAWHERFG